MNKPSFLSGLRVQILMCNKILPKCTKNQEVGLSRRDKTTPSSSMINRRLIIDTVFTPRERYTSCSTLVCLNSQGIWCYYVIIHIIILYDKCIMEILNGIT